MNVRPILFSGPMIRALLDGRKTQTRRAVKLPKWAVPDSLELNDSGVQAVALPSGCLSDVRCPYGKPGDLLWVRETTIRVEEHGYIGPVYAASEQGTAMLDWGIRPAADDVCDVEPEDVRLRPAIHMPRKYSRLTLRITDVRVQRLQDITEADAIAEGVFAGAVYPPDSFTDRQVLEWKPAEATVSAVDAYRSLWESINGHDSWAANPWVWALSFEVTCRNVDEMLGADEHLTAPTGAQMRTQADDRAA